MKVCIFIALLVAVVRGNVELAQFRSDGGDEPVSAEPNGARFRKGKKRVRSQRLATSQPQVSLGNGQQALPDIVLASEGIAIANDLIGSADTGVTRAQLKERDREVEELKQQIAALKAQAALSAAAASTATQKSGTQTTAALACPSCCYNVHTDCFFEGTWLAPPSCYGNCRCGRPHNNGRALNPPCNDPVAGCYGPGYVNPCTNNRLYKK